MEVEVRETKWIKRILLDHSDITVGTFEEQYLACLIQVLKDPVPKRWDACILRKILGTDKRTSVHILIKIWTFLQMCEMVY